MVPIIHFSGSFYFASPEYNNEPRKAGAPFDPGKPKAAVLAECGCDPTRYFDFNFLDVTVQQVTYADGRTATDGDPLLGMPLGVRGFLVDVCPSLVCAQLHAGKLTLGSRTLDGRIRKMSQSLLRKNVRSDPDPVGTLAAHFDTTVDLIRRPDGRGSRLISELGDCSTLELHLHLNRFNRFDAPENASTGEVFGYLRPAGGDTEGERRRRARKLVSHPDLVGPGWFFDTFLDVDADVQPPWYPPWYYDIEGSCDVSPDNRLVTLRYLDFLPYLDRSGRTPEVDRYDVVFESPAGRALLGSFRGNHEEMVRTGGVMTMGVPDGVDVLGEGRLSVEAVRGAERQPLVTETEWDLVLEGNRGLTLTSGDTATVTARVYRDNLPVADHPVRLITQGMNLRSPIVARFEAVEMRSDAEGRVRPEITATDLTEARGVWDPVVDGFVTELPLERYYGNYLWLEIDNPLRRNPCRKNKQTEVVELAVRVLHRVDESQLPSVPTFEADVRPLFSFYVRYFPWLHVREVNGRYLRFLDLESFESMRDLAPKILARLELPDDDLLKMPRSRDFPVGGEAVMRRWIETGLSRATG